MLYVGFPKRVRLFSSLLFSFLLIPSAMASEESFKNDLHYFKNALKMARFSQSGVEEFLNPYIGKSVFRLNESNAPWAGNYFPMQSGGIANRWQDQNKKLINLDWKPTKERLLTMNQERINRLSPAEKFDIAMGDYSFAVTTHEMINRGPKRPLKPEEWEGFCNGVRCAGIILPEPKQAIEITNKDGITVRFEPADLKALAGASYFYVEQYAQLGSPTNIGKSQFQPNPAVFDLTIRYYLAEKMKAFVFDSHLGNEIWNESAIGYRRTIGEAVNLTAAERARFQGAIKKAEVEVILESLAEIDIKKSNVETKKAVAEGKLHEHVPLHYTLYLNKKGQAIDGTWKQPKDTRGVDFVWFGGGKGTDAQYSENSGNPFLDFKRLKKLFTDSSKHICRSLFL